MNMPGYIGVCFDLDGVLADTELQDVAKYMAVARGHYGLHVGDDDFAVFHGKNGAQIHDYLIAQHGLGAGIDDFRAACAAHEAAHPETHRIAWREGAQALFNYWDARGLIVGVVTSSPLDKAEKKIRALGIEGRIQFLVSADDVTNKKPHPEPYLTGAAHITRIAGIAPGMLDPARILAVEDSRSAASARDAGQTTLLWRQLPSVSVEGVITVDGTAAMLNLAQRLVPPGGTGLRPLTAPV